MLGSTSNWYNMLLKNIRNNRQLEFSRLYQVAFLGKDNLPKVETLHLKTTSQLTEKDSPSLKNTLLKLPEKTRDQVDKTRLLLSSTWFSLVFIVDNREPVYESLSSFPFCQCSIYFPLSREKFIFSCVAVCESSKSFEGKKDSKEFQEFQNIWKNDMNKKEKNSFAKRDPTKPKPQSDIQYNM